MNVNKNGVRFVLSRARNLIAAEGTWTQGSIARDKFGAPKKVHDTSATCFCLIGSLRRAEGDDTPEREVACNLVSEEINIDRKPGEDRITLAKWNDASVRTHGDVIAALDRTMMRLDGVFGVAHA